MENVTIGLAFVAGLLSFISPCVLPLVPAYIGYLGGRMTHNMALITSNNISSKPSSHRVNMVLHGILFVLGFTTIFVLTGILTTALFSIAGSAVTVFKDIIGRVGGILIIIFGLHFMGVIRGLFTQLKQRPQWLNIGFSVLVLLASTALILWGFIDVLIALPLIAGLILALVLGGAFSSPHAFWLSTIERLEALLYSDTRGEIARKSEGGLGGSFMMGIVFAAGWTPCIGPLLGTILTIAANTGEVAQASALLMAYSLGLGIPFILTALLINQAQGLLRKLTRYMHQIEIFSGALLVFIGFLVASGQIASLSQNLGAQFADFSYRVEECGVGFLSGEIQVQHVGDCVGGVLLPINLNQSATLNLESNESQQLLFHLEEPITLEIQFISLKAGITATIELLDDQNQVIGRESGTSDKNTQPLILLRDTSVPAGLYRAIVSINYIDSSFRIKVVKSTPANETATTSDLDSVGSISTFAESAQYDADGYKIGTDIGDRAPDINVTTDTGESIRLSDLRGDVVIVNFWGTWCAPCRREMPELQGLYEDHQGDRLHIIGIAVRDEINAIQAFREEFGITFDLVPDTDERITDLYAVPGQPSTFILDTNGVVIWRSFSLVSPEALETKIQEALQAS